MPLNIYEAEVSRGKNHPVERVTVKAPDALTAGRYAKAYFAETLPPQAALFVTIKEVAR